MNFKKFHENRNLFDKSNTDLIFAGTTLAIANEWNGGGGISKVIRIPCEPLTTYTISGESESSIFRISLSELETAPDPVSGSVECIDVLRASSVSTQTFTTTDNTKYILVQVGASAFNDYINVLMLNTGSTPLPYEPYSSEVWHDIPHYIHNTSIDTITTLPAIIYPNDTTATVGLKGNMVQNGTPTPTNPIQPSECGDRTGNLLDKSAFTGVGATIEQIKDGIRITTPSNGYAAVIVLDVPQNTDYSLSYIWKYISGNSANTVRVFAGTGSSTQIAMFTYSNGGTFNTGNNTKINIWFYAAFSAAATVEYTKIMLNTGSEALPYEPYGYKIPILSNSTTTPVYLGEVETTRKIWKKVLDGTETTWTSAILQGRMNFNWKTGIQNPTGAYVLSTHYKSEYAVREGVCFITANNVSFIDSRFQSLDDFKNFLADEYAAGHPVTVWYVDANPTTRIVNEPIRKIGVYADTVSGITIPTTAGADSFDVLTTLKPSEVTANYHGWHTGAVHERDSGAWD